MENKETIRNTSLMVKGYVETKPNGDKVVTDFYGRILGYYRAGNNTTTDFYGRIISYGDTASGLIDLR